MDENTGSEIYNNVKRIIKLVYELSENEIENIKEEMLLREIVGTFNTVQKINPERPMYDALLDLEEELSGLMDTEKDIFSMYREEPEDSSLTGMPELFSRSAIHIEDLEGVDKTGRDVFIIDLRDSAHKMLEEENEKHRRQDIYSVMMRGATMGMSKGRGDYVRPYARRQERREEERENAPSDDQLAQDWGYEDWDDFSSTM